MPDRLQHFAFLLCPDDGEGNDASIVVLGIFKAPPSLDEAMMRGRLMFLSEGSTAADVAAREYGGHWRDYPSACFSVREADEDEIIEYNARSLEAKDYSHFGPDQ